MLLVPLLRLIIVMMTTMAMTTMVTVMVWLQCGDGRDVDDVHGDVVEDNKTNNTAANDDDDDDGGVGR